MEYDDNGAVTNVWINDTGAGTCSQQVPIATWNSATGPAIGTWQSNVTDNPIYFVAPHVLATLDATSGDVESRKEVLPRDLGVTQKPGELIGLHVLAQGMTAEEYAARRIRLFELYDQLADSFVKGEDAHRHARQAAEFRTLFLRLSEVPLAPYYRSVGRAFFSWVQEA